MLISVLVPVYGVERYIERCAVSLFEQTYADLEYIFIDDCTPDRSVSVLRSVMARYPQRQPQVRVIRNDKNRGLGYTRARAVSEARGFCVLNVDSDDYVPPRAVELLARRMEATGADIVDGSWQEAGHEGLSAVMKAPCVRSRARLVRLMLCQDFVPNHLWARLIRRGLYTDNGINTVEGVDYSEDFSVMPRLMSVASRAVIEDVVYYYNVDNQSSYTHSMTEKHLVSLIRSNRIVYEFFTVSRPDSRYRAAAQVGLLNMMRNVRRCGGSSELIERYCPLHVSGALFRLLERCLRGALPLRLADLLFLVVRRIVATF